MRLSRGASPPGPRAAVHQQHGRTSGANERPPDRAETLGAPARRQAADDDGRLRDGGEKRLLGRVGEQGLRGDADDALSRQGRVGQEPARVPLAAARIGLRPDQPERHARSCREPGSERKRRPVALAAAERDEDAVAALPVRSRSTQRGDVGRRPFRDGGEVGRQPVAVKPGGRVEEDELDIVVRREADDVARRLERRERGHAGGNVEGLAPCVERGRGGGDVVFLGEETRDEQRAVGERHQRERDRQQRVGAVVVEGGDEDGPLDLDPRLRRL